MKPLTISTMERSVLNAFLSFALSTWVDAINRTGDLDCGFDWETLKATWATLGDSGCGSRENCDEALGVSCGKLMAIVGASTQAAGLVGVFFFSFVLVVEYVVDPIRRLCQDDARIKDLV